MNKQEKLAHKMYDTYCEAVGGVAFNGDPLPKSTEFFADQKKQKQADAWRESAKVACCSNRCDTEAELAELPRPVAESKQFRKDLDLVLQEIKTAERKSRERSIAITKIQEAIMWLGMDLKALNEEGVTGTENPYPQSYNPDSPVIEKTADNLKL